MAYKRTDLAIEQAELCREQAQQESQIEGVTVEETDKDGIKITRVKVENEAGSKALAKPVGTYVTLETEHLSYEDKEQYAALCAALKAELAGIGAGRPPEAGARGGTGQPEHHGGRVGAENRRADARDAPPV